MLKKGNLFLEQNIFLIICNMGFLCPNCLCYAIATGNKSVADERGARAGAPFAKESQLGASFFGELCAPQCAQRHYFLKLFSSEFGASVQIMMLM